MVRDTIQLEDAVSTISQEYLLEFTSEYGILESLHPELPGLEEPIVEFSKGKVGVYTNYRRSQRWISFSKRPGKNIPHCYTKPLDSLKNWNNRFFWVYEKIFPTVVEWGTNAPKDEMPSADSYSATDVTTLNTRHMDLFNLISAPNPTKVKTGTRPCTAHEVPLLTATASRVIDMEDTIAIKSNGHGGRSRNLEKEVAAMGPLVNKSRRKRGNDEADANAPPKVLRKGHAVSRLIKITLGGKSLASIGLEAGSTFSVPASQETPADVRDPDPLSYAKPQLHPKRDVAHKAATKIPTGHIATTEVQGQIFAESPESGKSASFSSAGGSPRGIFQLEWGVINNCRLDTSDACQDMVDHIVPPGYIYLYKRV
ncbi:hypothetical protein Tco_0670696 [Tanacetum coccineum]